MNQFVVVASINAMSQVFGWVTYVTHLMAGVTHSQDCATPLSIKEMVKNATRNKKSVDTFNWLPTHFDFDFI